MGADERTAWLTIAIETLSHLTLGQLREGCRNARMTCRFPSEIVPAVIGGTAEPRRQYISASGFIYRGDDTEVMRVAEQRADWNTYWSAKGNRDRARLAGKEEAPRLGYAAPIGALRISGIDEGDGEDFE
jgi:hypothetical protein